MPREEHSAVSWTFYFPAFLSRLDWEMSGGFHISATKTEEVTLDWIGNTNDQD